MATVRYIRGGSEAINEWPIVDGQILCDVENACWYVDAYIDIELKRIVLVKPPFVGTKETWNALTDEEKAQYTGTTVIITNDFVHENSDMQGATASSDGAAGLVPAPSAGDQGKVFYGDGKWKNPPDTTYAFTTGSVGSASEGVDVDLTRITSYVAGSVPTLGTAIDADDITSWSAGSVPVCTIDSVDTEHVIFSAGSAPNLQYTAKTIPNVTDAGSMPTLTFDQKTLPRIVLTPTTVVTGATPNS